MTQERVEVPHELVVVELFPEWKRNLHRLDSAIRGHAASHFDLLRRKPKTPDLYETRKSLGFDFEEIDNYLELVIRLSLIHI